MKFPRTIHNGACSVRVYRIKSKTAILKNGERRLYRGFELRYRGADGRRRRDKFPDDGAAAVAAAQKIAGDLAKGLAILPDAPEDKARWARALTLCFPHRLPVDDAVADWDRARRRLPAGMTVEEAVIRLEQAGLLAGTAQESAGVVVDEFLSWIKGRGLSVRHTRDLVSRLKPFRASFATLDFAAITPAMVDGFVAGRPGSARNRANTLNAIKNLFAWARFHNRTAQSLSGVRPPAKSASRSVNEIWRPAEMRLLLDTARAPFRDKKGRWVTQEDVIPYLAIGAFAKLRAAELERLDWAQVRFAEGVIVVKRAQAKTKKARKIVMPANLVAWLSPYAKLSGPVVVRGNVHKQLRKLAGRCGLKWRRNALRNSASTYHAMLSRDLKLVSMEAGNSPQVLEAEYLELEGATAADAAAWFEIFPGASDGSASEVLLPLFAGASA